MFRRYMCKIVLSMDYKEIYISIVFLVYLSYLLMISVVINGGGKD